MLPNVAELLIIFITLDTSKYIYIQYISIYLWVIYDNSHNSHNEYYADLWI